MGRGIVWAALLVVLVATDGITAVSAEGEPNDTPGQATALGDPLNGTLVQGFVAPDGDVDVWSFQAQVGDRVSVATMTSWSPSDTDSEIAVLASDGVTILEADANDGTHGSMSSVIAGLTLPATGTYFVRVQALSASAQIRPYDLNVESDRGSGEDTPWTRRDGNDASDAGGVAWAAPSSP